MSDTGYLICTFVGTETYRLRSAVLSISFSSLCPSGWALAQSGECFCLLRSSWAEDGGAVSEGSTCCWPQSPWNHVCIPLFPCSSPPQPTPTVYYYCWWCQSFSPLLNHEDTALFLLHFLHLSYLCAQYNFFTPSKMSPPHESWHSH